MKRCNAVPQTGKSDARYAILYPLYRTLEVDLVSPHKNEGLSGL